MSDDDIIERGGTQEDIDAYAHDVGGACGAVYGGRCDYCGNVTPTEQDKELHELVDKFINDIAVLRPYTRVTKEAKRRLAQLITADRKRVALEARINENNMYIRELPRHYFPSGPGEPHIPLVQFHERIAELKAQQEEV